MRSHGGASRRRDRFRICLAAALPLAEGPPGREIAVRGIMCGCLVGNEVRQDAAPQDFRKHFGGVSEQPDRTGLPLLAPACHHRESLVQTARPFVEIPCAEAQLDAFAIALDREAGGARECGR